AMLFAPFAFTRAMTPGGQSAARWLSRITAPASRRSSTLSFSQKGPLTYSPGGRYATPPPRLAQRSMAAWIAAAPPGVTWQRLPVSAAGPGHSKRTAARRNAVRRRITVVTVSYGVVTSPDASRRLGSTEAGGFMPDKRYVAAFLVLATTVIGSGGRAQSQEAKHPEHEWDYGKDHGP